MAVSIEVGAHEPMEKVLKRFKRLIDKEGIIKECKKREFYEKPSTIKNRKKKSLQRKIAKKIRRLRTGRYY